MWDFFVVPFVYDGDKEVDGTKTQHQISSESWNQYIYEMLLAIYRDNALKKTATNATPTGKTPF